MKTILSVLLLTLSVFNLKSHGSAGKRQNIIPAICFSLRDTVPAIMPESEGKNSVPMIESLSAEHFSYSIRFNFPVEQILDLNLFKVVSDWYGVRYQLGGNGKKGIDCSALTQRLVKDAFCIDLSRVVGGQYRQCVPISRQELMQGDLIFFETFRPGLSHVGLYLGDNKFVHASSNKGVTIDDLNNTYYKRTFRKCGRIIGKKP